MESDDTSPQSSTPEPESGANTLRLDPSSRVTGIGVTSLLSMDGRAIVQLVIKGPGDRSLMESSQDLEDTLALGAFVVEAVGDVLSTLVDVVKEPVWRGRIGDDFEAYLARTEKSTRKIRALLKVSE